MQLFRTHSPALCNKELESKCGYGILKLDKKSSVLIRCSSFCSISVLYLFAKHLRFETLSVQRRNREFSKANAAACEDLELFTCQVCSCSAYVSME